MGVGEVVCLLFLVCLFVFIWLYVQAPDFDVDSVVRC